MSVAELKSRADAFLVTKKRARDESRRILVPDDGHVLTAEDEQTASRLLDEAENAESQAAVLMRQYTLESREAESAGTIAGQGDADGTPASRAGADGSLDEATQAEQRAAIAAWNRSLIDGVGALTDIELRALQVDSAEAGGYLVPPTRWLTQLIQAVDDAVFVRTLATKLTVTNAQSVGRPSLDADPADADWTAEIATGNEDTSMDFGKRELTPHPLAKLLRVSDKLIRSTAGGLNVEAIVRERLAIVFGETQEKAFLTGTGSNQPLGVFTADVNGISTGRDVSQGNTATAIGMDNLLRVKYSLKSQYWRVARWMFHRDGVLQVALIKDGNGQYIWRDSVRAGEPDMLLGRPVMMSEFAPNTFTTGLYVGILGDWSKYWIVDALSFTLKRLVELYAATNQIGYIGRLETDGMPVLEEAFARVTLA